MKQTAKAVLVFAVLVIVASSPSFANAQSGGARLFLSPSSGSYTVGETFNVSVFVDTNGNNINAVDVRIKFPSDKLQVVSPSIGRSIVGIWTAPPSFNNSTGDIIFQGGIPNPGIETSQGLVSTIQFRTRSVGTASINFSGNSKVLLNDGFGTDILTDTEGSRLSLALPGPAGPAVASETHPDQDKWYKNSTVVFTWSNVFPVEGYSYVLSSNPLDEPDNISEGRQEETSYKSLNDGFHYFHIKALRDGTWGGTTHYAAKIDSTPPAEFKIDIRPRRRTANRTPVVAHTTTDAGSGVSHYELKIVPLDPERAAEAAEPGDEGFFIEVGEQYVPPQDLELGEYDIVVRAFDNAGNFRASVERLHIVNPTVTVLSTGLVLFDRYTIPWSVVILGGLLIIGFLLYLFRLAVEVHHDATIQQVTGAMNDPVIKRRLEELEEKKRRYRDTRHKYVAVLLALTAAFGLWGSPVHAQEAGRAFLPPPVITTVPENISDEQLFHVSGRSDVSDGDVIVYIQNLQDNQVISGTVQTDGRGDWFYAHPDPLSRGNYLVWAQLRVGSQYSPPSPQNEVGVTRTAFEIGSSRLSYETLYLFIAIAFFLGFVVLGGLTVFHFYHGRRKHKNISKEILEAENAVKEGFLLLRRDIGEELDIIHQARLNKKLSKEHEEKERELREHLREVEEYIRKEFRDVKVKAKKIAF